MGVRRSHGSKGHSWPAAVHRLFVGILVSGRRWDQTPPPFRGAPVPHPAATNGKNSPRKPGVASAAAGFRRHRFFLEKKPSIRACPNTRIAITMKESAARGWAPAERHPGPLEGIGK
jgi:hypothetical protein